jgi:phosphate transport system protein
MERRFDLQLEKLKKRIIRMSSLVNVQVDNVLYAVRTGDKQMASKIIKLEIKVDRFDVKIEKQCLKLVVLNQPVAMDLRFVFSAITINSSLERIGDLAANIAKGMLEVEFSQDELEMIDYASLSEIAREMVKKALDAFIHKNADLAMEALELEKSMNTFRDSKSVLLKNYMRENPDRIYAGMFLYDMIHSLERIGDLCTNIAEDVYFIIEAQNIRHKYEDILFPDSDNGSEDE